MEKLKGQSGALRDTMLSNIEQELDDTKSELMSVEMGIVRTLDVRPWTTGSSLASVLNMIARLTCA